MKRRNRSRRAGEAKHVRLYAYMLKAPAWRSLSCLARCLLVEFGMLYNGANNGELVMSVRTAAALLRTGTKQASAAIAELVDRGFIRSTRKGVVTGRGENRIATTWRLTEHADDLTGREASKEFTRWKPTDSTVVSETTHRGPRDHGQAAADVSHINDRGPRDHGQGRFDGATVVSETTHIVNQREGARCVQTSQSARPEQVIEFACARVAINGHMLDCGDIHAAGSARAHHLRVVHGARRAAG